MMKISIKKARHFSWEGPYFLSLFLKTRDFDWICTFFEVQMRVERALAIPSRVHSHFILTLISRNASTSFPDLHPSTICSIALCGAFCRLRSLSFELFYSFPRGGRLTIPICRQGELSSCYASWLNGYLTLWPVRPRTQSSDWECFKVHEWWLLLQ